MSFTPQKPPRPTTSARGMRTPVKASSSSPFAKGSGGGSPLMVRCYPCMDCIDVEWCVNETKHYQ